MTKQELIESKDEEMNGLIEIHHEQWTTGVACRNLNRYFIGIEKDEKYFAIAEKRII